MHKLIKEDSHKLIIIIYIDVCGTINKPKAVFDPLTAKIIGCHVLRFEGSNLIVLEVRVLLLACKLLFRRFYFLGLWALFVKRNA